MCSAHVHIVCMQLTANAKGTISDKSESFNSSIGIIIKCL